uniref:hypothetical protein n=1 Tax=Porphyridium aerugineum TaxID=2792 RepID=UPI001FCDA242|nr:hypothetical protein MW505_pgp026 [Porphyridium aerugineum]UNJ17971.1 hypothetical protein [Porphyridium aerugineum]
MYHAIIENNHKITALDEKRLFFGFQPKDAIINVNIYNQNNNFSIDWDLIECLSFIEAPGIWLNKTKKSNAN